MILVVPSLLGLGVRSGLGRRVGGGGGDERILRRGKEGVEEKVGG